LKKKLDSRPFLWETHGYNQAFYLVRNPYAFESEVKNTYIFGLLGTAKKFFDLMVKK